MASHRQGLSQDLKKEDNSPSTRACYCPSDTYLKLTVNIKNTLLIINWRTVAEPDTCGSILCVFLLKSGVVLKLLAEMMWTLVLMEGGYLVIRWKLAATIVNLQANRLFCLYHWLVGWLLQELHRNYVHNEKITKGKSLMVQLPWKASIVHNIFRTHCFRLESQGRLFILFYPVSLFQPSLVEKQLNCPSNVWKSWPRWKCQVAYCFSEST